MFFTLTINFKNGKQIRIDLEDVDVTSEEVGFTVENTWQSYKMSEIESLNFSTLS